MRPTLLTRRLVGRPAGPADLKALRALHTHPRVTPWLSADGAPLPPERSAGFLADARDHRTRHGFGVFTLRARRGGRFVGYCGLRRVVVEGRPAVELLYALMPAAWGRGYAREAAAAVLARYRGRVAGRALVAYTLPHNRRSRRVMEACGFRHAGPIVHAGLPHVLYRAPVRLKPGPGAARA